MARIGVGLLLFVGFGRDDGPAEAGALARKVAHLRIFESESSKFDRSVLDAGGQVLTVAQLTLYADTSRGRRPNFSQACPPSRAAELYGLFGSELRRTGIEEPVQAPFGARLLVAAENWGPFTVTLDAGTCPTG